MSTPTTPPGGGTTPDVPRGTGSLARSSLVMAGGTLASRLLGVVRYAVLLAAIGNITPAAVAWQNANTLPNTIYLLLAAGVLNAVLLPQLSRAMTRGEEGQDYSDRLLTLALTVLVAGTVLFVAAAPLVAKLYALDWAWDDPLLRLTILFAYLCIPQMLFYGLHTLMGQILAAHHRFAAFMWSPVLNNVVTILGLLVFLRAYPDAGSREPQAWTAPMILLLAVPATLGIVVQALVLVPAVRATGFRYRPRWGFRGVGLGSASRMTGWTMADVATSQLGLLVAMNVINWASRTGDEVPGRATYDYAFSAFILPHSLIAFSLLTAIYPVLTKAAAAGDLRSMADDAARGLRLLGVAMVPVAVGLVLLAEPFLRVIYPSLAPDELGHMARILTALTVGLVPYGVYLLCARVFYSFEDGRTPYLFQVGITTVTVTVVLLATTMSPLMVAAMVGLGQALGQTTAAVLGLLFVRRRLPSIGLRAVGGTFLRAAAAAVLAALPTYAVSRWLSGDELPWGRALLLLAVCGLLFLSLYVVLAHLFGVTELREAAAPLLRRLPGRRAAAGPAGGLASDAADAADPASDAALAPVSAGDETGAVGRTAWETAYPQQTGTDGRGDLARQAAGGRLGWDIARQQDGRGDGERGARMEGLTPGTVLAERYALEELLARRDEGSLDYWSARDTTLDRLVAVTALTTDGADGRDEAVLDAARRVASVDDPRLVRVLDVGREGDLCWIVEEGLADAESLAALVAERALPAEEVRRLVGEAAAGLESARRRGLHHLYLNPHSLLRTTDGGVKIAGVGVAAAMEGTEDITADEASLIDTADLVALLYTGLTGLWPGEDLAGVRPARRLADGGLPAPSELVAGVPGDLDSLCRLVHGSAADLSMAPHTPGDLARLLSPWSSERVRAERPASLSAPAPQASGSELAAAALAGGAGAGAAVTAARGAAEDHTEVVPAATYYRTTGRGTGVPAGHQPRTEVVPAPGPRGPVAWVPGGARDDRVPTGPEGGDRGDRGGEGLPEARGSLLQTAVVLVLILALLAVAAGLAWGALRGLTDRGADDDPAATPGATTDASATSGDQATGSAAAPKPTAEPSGTAGAGADPAGLPVVGVASFDPQGDGNERNDLAPRAVDGDAESAWRSHRYLTPGWGGLKDGTGLIVDLGEGGAEVSSVDLLLGSADAAAAVYVAERPTLDGATELASEDAVSGEWEVRADEPVTGRYVIVWFTSPMSSAGGDFVQVHELSVG